MKTKCQLCKRETEKIHHWCNALIEFPHLKVCEECNLSVNKQIFLLVQDEFNYWLEEQKEK